MTQSNFRPSRIALAVASALACFSLAHAQQMTINSATLDTLTGKNSGFSTSQGDMTKFFKVQKDVVYSVLNGLGVPPSTLPPDIRAAIDKPQTTDPKAFEAFSRGVEAADKGNFAEAGKAFGEAARIDPGFGLASGLAKAMPNIDVSNATAQEKAAAVSNSKRGAEQKARQEARDLVEKIANKSSDAEKSEGKGKSGAGSRVLAAVGEKGDGKGSTAANIKARIAEQVREVLADNAQEDSGEKGSPSGTDTKGKRQERLLNSLAISDDQSGPAQRVSQRGSALDLEQQQGSERGGFGSSGGSGGLIEAGGFVHLQDKAALDYVVVAQKSEDFKQVETRLSAVTFSDLAATLTGSFITLPAATTTTTTTTNTLLQQATATASQERTQATLSSSRSSNQGYLDFAAKAFNLTGGIGAYYSSSSSGWYWHLWTAGGISAPTALSNTSFRYGSGNVSTVNILGGNTYSYCSSSASSCVSYYHTNLYGTSGINGNGSGNFLISQAKDALLGYENYTDANGNFVSSKIFYGLPTVANTLPTTGTEQFSLNTVLLSSASAYNSEYFNSALNWATKKVVGVSYPQHQAGYMLIGQINPATSTLTTTYLFTGSGYSSSNLRGTPAAFDAQFIGSGGFALLGTHTATEVNLANSSALLYSSYYSTLADTYSSLGTSSTYASSSSSSSSSSSTSSYRWSPSNGLTNIGLYAKATTVPPVQNEVWAGGAVHQYRSGSTTLSDVSGVTVLTLKPDTGDFKATIYSEDRNTSTTLDTTTFPTLVNGQAVTKAGAYVDTRHLAAYSLASSTTNPDYLVSGEYLYGDSNSASLMNMTFGRFGLSDGTANAGSWWFAGRLTHANEVPSTGTASFRGAYAGNYYYGTTNYGTTSGGVRINVDFANNLMAFRFSGGKLDALSASGSLSRSISTAPYLSTPTQIAGIEHTINLVNASNSVVGKVDAVFFGTGTNAATEVGGSWSWSDSTYTAAGIYAAQQMASPSSFGCGSSAACQLGLIHATVPNTGRGLAEVWPGDTARFALSTSNGISYQASTQPFSGLSGSSAATFSFDALGLSGYSYGSNFYYRADGTYLDAPALPSGFSYLSLWDKTGLSSVYGQNMSTYSTGFHSQDRDFFVINLDSNLNTWDSTRSHVTLVTGTPTPASALPSSGIWLYNVFASAVDPSTGRFAGATPGVEDNGYVAVNWSTGKVIYIGDVINSTTSNSSSSASSGKEIAIGRVNRSTGIEMYAGERRTYQTNWDSARVRDAEVTPGSSSTDHIALFGASKPVGFVTSDDSLISLTQGSSVSASAPVQMTYIGALLSTNMASSISTQPTDGEQWKGFAVATSKAASNNASYGGFTQSVSSSSSDVTLTLKPSTGDFSATVTAGSQSVTVDSANTAQTAGAMVSQNAMAAYNLNGSGTVFASGGAECSSTTSCSQVYEHLTWGRWAKDDANTTVSPGSYWIAGRMTPANEVPTTGSATYTGQLGGQWVNSSGQLAGYASGAVSLTADFANRTMGGTLNISQTSNGASSASSTHTATLSNVSWAAGTNGYAGNLTGSTLSSGNIKGAFYGPAAAETGGAWQVTTTGGNTAAGIFRGKK